MPWKERLIQFQNQAERSWEHKKSLTTGVNYFLAFVLFMGSTLFAGITLPFRKFRKKKQEDQEGLHYLSQSNFNTVIRQEQVLLEFGADWCGPCVMMEPTLEQFAQETDHVLVGKIDADTDPQLLKHYNIKGLPHLLFLKNGEEIRRHAGPMTRKELERFTQTS